MLVKTVKILWTQTHRVAFHIVAFFQIVLLVIVMHVPFIVIFMALEVSIEK